MKRILFLGIILSLLWQGIGLSETGRPPGFMELWNNIAYYDTNLERKGFASFLGRFEGKFGLNLFNSPLQAYGTYYSAFSQSEDYWDNYLFSGVGIRYKPFESFGGGWMTEWVRDVRLFAESLNAGYLKGAASAESSGLAKTDTRYGLDLWHEWNLDNADESLPWGELWANLSYRNTNFSSPPNFNNWILYFQPKIGGHWGRGIEPYIRADLTMSGKQGPNYYFLNVADYGIGLRFEPWRKEGELSDLLRKFKMFAEILSVSYLNDKPAANNNVSTDARFGIDFSYGR